MAISLGFMGFVRGGEVSFRKRLTNGTLREMDVDSEGNKVYRTLETSKSKPSSYDIRGLSAERFDLSNQAMPDLTSREVAMQHLLNVFVHDLLVASDDPKSLATRGELLQLGLRTSALVDKLEKINDELTSFGY